MNRLKVKRLKVNNLKSRLLCFTLSPHGPNWSLIGTTTTGARAYRGWNWTVTPAGPSIGRVLFR